MSKYFLQSRRLGFRAWSSADIPIAEALWGDPEVTQLLGGPFSIEAIRGRLDHKVPVT